MRSERVEARRAGVWRISNELKMAGKSTASVLERRALATALEGGQAGEGCGESNRFWLWKGAKATEKASGVASGRMM